MADNLGYGYGRCYVVLDSSYPHTIHYSETIYHMFLSLQLLAAPKMIARPLTNFVERLRLREVSNKGKLQLNRGHIFRDYHFHEFGLGLLELRGFGITYGKITDLVIAADIICVIYDSTHLIPFRRNGDISACRNVNGGLIVNHWDGVIKDVCYNSINDSLLTVISMERSERIINTEFASIITGEISEGRIELFRDESIRDWNFDVPNGRCIIHDAHDGVFKVFDMNYYRYLFTIPYTGYTEFLPGKTDHIAMYHIIQKEYEEEIQRFFKFYCKFTGQLKKQFNVRGSYLDFITACGRDLIVSQLRYPDGMLLIDISPEVHRLIRTRLYSEGEPIYLEKKRQLICKTINRNDSVGAFNLEGERSLTLRDLPDFFLFSCTTKNQDVAIFVSMVPLSIHVKCILTGNTLANFRVNDSMSSWNAFGIKQFEHDQATHEIFMVNSRDNCCIWSNKYVEHD